MTGNLVARPSLTDGQRRRMLSLLDASFSHITAEQFHRDLAEKNWVILIHDDAHRIVGFSTLLLYRTTCGDSPIAVIYSGDTIIEREAWGSSALPRTWIRAVWDLHQAAYPALPLYWLLLTSGYRTYRFLSVFWREFYPSHARAAPAKMQQLLEQLALDRFGARYDPRAGVVHLGQPLREELREIPASKLADPHVAFFAKNNPGYVHGDELACVAPLTEANLTAAGRRMVRAGKSEQRI